MYRDEAVKQANIVLYFTFWSSLDPPFGDTLMLCAGYAWIL